MGVNELTERVISAAIEVHRALGPGLLQSVYEECFCTELSIRGVNYVRRSELPIEFKGIRLDCGCRVGILVEEILVIELKAVDSILPIHEAQLLTCMKIGGFKVGLIINFNVTLLKQGIRRRVLNLSRADDICLRSV